MTIDDATGDMYLLRTSVHQESDGYHTDAHDIVEFTPSGQSVYTEAGALSVEQLGFVNDYDFALPVVIGAANGELAIAGVRQVGNTGTRVTVAVTRGVNSPLTEYTWDLAQTPSGSAPISTTPLGVRAFDVRSVAVSGQGDVYVAGASLGDFDGQPLVQGVWLGGWLSRFWAPVPPA